MSSRRRIMRQRPISLHTLVRFRGVPFPLGWETALINQNYKCIECQGEFGHRRNDLKADFHHDKEKILRAICSKCNDAVHGKMVSWPRRGRPRHIESDPTSNINP